MWYMFGGKKKVIVYSIVKFRENIVWKTVD